VPYAFVLAGSVVFTVASATVTLGCMVWVRARRWYSYAWRAWLWATLGFVLAIALLIASFMPTLSRVGISSAPTLQYHVLGALLAAVAVFGRFVASGVGILAGTLLGIWLAARKERASGAIA